MYKVEIRDCVKRLLRPNSVDELPRPGKHCGQEVICVSMKLERRVGLESQLKLNNAEWLPRPFHTASNILHLSPYIRFTRVSRHQPLLRIEMEKASTLYLGQQTTSTGQKRLCFGDIGTEHFQVSIEATLTGSHARDSKTHLDIDSTLC